MPTTLSAAASAAELFETIYSVEERRADYVPSQEPKKKVRTVDVSEESELAAQVAELSLQVRALTRTTVNNRQTSMSQERGRTRDRSDSERRREQSRSTSRGALRSVERASLAITSQPNQEAPRVRAIHLQPAYTEAQLADLQQQDDNIVPVYKAMEAGERPTANDVTSWPATAKSYWQD